MRRILLIHYVLIPILLFFFLTGKTYSQLPCSQPNGVILVTNTEDEGPGSLREAINCANSTPGPNTIQFNIISFFDSEIFVGANTGEPLPPLTDDGTIIDGSTHPAHGLNGDFSPKVILDGSENNWTLPINALLIQGDACEIYALEIRNFPDDGIDVNNADNVRIGAPFKGNIIYNNGSDVDFFPGLPNTGPWEGAGIVLRNGTNNCFVYNNIIGTNEFLLPGLGNEYAGVNVRDGANTNKIGRQEEQKNIIAGNRFGVRVANSVGISINQNQMFCNAEKGIELIDFGNQNKAAPQITEATPAFISGTAAAGDVVEIYLNDAQDCPGSPCQGKYLLGVIQTFSGFWKIESPFFGNIQLFNGDLITATATSFNNNTSEFAPCTSVIDLQDCLDSNGIIMVTNTADAGSGSLRAAIECANSVPGANLINFNISEDLLDTIFVGSASGDPLPALTDTGTVIDATSQPGFGDSSNYQPLIILDGIKTNWTFPHNALWIRADHCEVYGLEIRNFPDDGIDVTDAFGVTVGAPNKGNVIYNNGLETDTFPDGPPNSGPWEGCGIVLKNGSSNCKVQGNTIGTNYSRTIQGGNEFCGIIVMNSGKSHLIGGTEAGQANVIAYNPTGIRIEKGADFCRIAQNKLYCNDTIGIALAGEGNQNKAKPTIDTASSVFIGGTAQKGDLIEVFLQKMDTTCPDAACQGFYFLGSAVASVDDSTWTLSGPFTIPPGMADYLVTATATDTLDNTSEYADCMEMEVMCSINAGVKEVIGDSCRQETGQIYLSINSTSFVKFILYNQDTFVPGPIILPFPQEDYVLTGLAADTYLIIVVTEDGCSDTLEVVVPGVGDLPQVEFEYGHTGELVYQFLAFSFNGPAAYVWDFGDGDTAAGVFVQHIYQQTGFYTVCLTATNDCGDTVICKQILGFSPNDRVVFDGGEANGNRGDTVKIPVRVENFTDILGFQFSMNLLKPELGRFVGVTDFGLPGMSAGSFFITDTNITVSWLDFMLNPATVADSAIIFSIEVELFQDAPGCCGIISLDDNPTPAEVIRLIENEQVEVPFLLFDGLVCPPLRVEGLIKREDSQPVGQVVVYCDSDSTAPTGPNGLYACLNAKGPGPVEVVPKKDINAKNGVTALDMAEIQKHILFIELLDSPYKIIAADADNSRNVTAIDLTVIQKIILSIINKFPNSDTWRFVPEDYSFPDPMNPFLEIFPETAVLTELIRDTSGVDFIGVKVADVNVDNNPLNFTGADPFVISVSGTPASAGQEISLIFSPHKNRQLIGLQGTLEFDPGILEFVDILPGSIPGISPASFNIMATASGNLPFVWWDIFGQAQGQFFQKGEPLFTLKFKTLKPVSSLYNLFSLSDDLTLTKAYAPNKTGMPVELNFSTVTGTSETASSSGMNIIAVMPNPFRDQTAVRFYNPKDQEVVLEVHSSAGQLVYREKKDFGKGLQDWVVEGERLGGVGVYVFRLKTGKGNITGRLVKMP